MSDFTETPELPPAGPLPIPWERPGAGMGDLFTTIKLIVSNPAGAFARVPATKAVGRALIFGLLVYTVCNALAQLWTLALGNSMQALLEKVGGEAFRGMAQQQISPVFTYLLQVFVGPIIYLVCAFIGSGIMHLLLMLFGGAPGGYTTTLRTYFYTSVAVIASIIPFIGGLITLVWWIVLLIIGFKEAHRIPVGRSVAAVLVPMLLCCVCIIVLAVTFATALMSMFGGGGN